jgi:hypothetical protein
LTGYPLFLTQQIRAFEVYRTTLTSEATAWLFMVERMPAQMLCASEAFVATGMFTNVILLHIGIPAIQSNFIFTTSRHTKTQREQYAAAKMELIRMWGVLDGAV